MCAKYSLRLTNGCRRDDRQQTMPTTPSPAQIPVRGATALGFLPQVLTVKALLLPGVEEAGSRKPPFGEAIHPCPVEAAALAASPQRLEPAFCDSCPEHVERFDVGQQAVVRVVPTQNSTQPFSLLDDRFVNTTTQFTTDLMNLLCSFAYTFKRTVRIGPALCPGCGRRFPRRRPVCA